MTAALSPELCTWRYRVFAATWLSYAGYYFCRQPFYVAKATLGKTYGWDAGKLGLLGTFYLFSYMVGQFAAGCTGNRTGARALLLAGMAVSASANFAFGLTESFAMFAALMLLNGLAQATGWSANVGTMAAWYDRHERGKVMGLWATNFQVGGIGARWLAAFALGLLGYRYSFFAGSIVLVVVLVVVFLNQRNRPEDVGLALPATANESSLDDGSVEVRVETIDAPWTTQMIVNVAIVGVFYFFSKLIRYALWSWVPYLFETRFHMKADQAGYLSTVFDIAGITGVIAAGWLSDKLFHSRRAGISLIFVVAMVAACLFLYLLGSHSPMLFAVSIGLVGFTLFGPDALMTGAGAIDVAGSRRNAVLSVGVINGMGSLGPIAQELALGNMLKHGGVDRVFGVLLACSVLAGVALAVLVWRNRTGKADV